MKKTSDYQALLDAMYADDPEIDTPTPPLLGFARQGGNITTLTIDGVKVDVPSVAYVARLEHRLAEQATAFKRLEALLVATRNYVRHHTNDLNRQTARLGEQVEVKIDRREPL